MFDSNEGHVIKQYHMSCLPTSYAIDLRSAKFYANACGLISSNLYNPFWKVSYSCIGPIHCPVCWLLYWIHFLCLLFFVCVLYWLSSWRIKFIIIMYKAIVHVVVCSGPWFWCQSAKLCRVRCNIVRNAKCKSTRIFSLLYLN